MSLLKFTEEELQKFEEINALYNNNAIKSSESILSEFGTYLLKCESYHINETYKTEGYVHDMENMFALFIINLLIDEGFLTKKIRDLGLPKSHIEKPLLNIGDTLKTILEIISNDFIAEDGTLYYFSKYCQLDVLWIAVLVYYAFFKYIDPSAKHEFVITPNPLPKPISPPKKIKNTKIAILGDWGTGSWTDGELACSPAELVIKGIESLNPDYVIHLGDVYYAGTKHEEHNKFIKLLEGKSLGKLYTMNSNHEMYDVARGLYDVTLANDLFKHQQGRTYFSIDIGDWILVGLDSAYFDESSLYMDGSLYKDIATGIQYDFLNDISKQGKPIFLMTHHNGIGIKDQEFTINKKLWSQVEKCLDGKMPDMWYWGHVHNGVVYNTDKLTFPETTIPKSTTGKTPQFRCCGHGSIPFGDATGFYTKQNGKKVMKEELAYYAQTPLPIHNINPTHSQKVRVLNGFAMIEIDGPGITETFYEVSNEHPKPNAVWCSK